MEHGPPAEGPSGAVKKGYCRFSDSRCSQKRIFERFEGLGGPGGSHFQGAAISPKEFAAQRGHCFGGRMVLRSCWSAGDATNVSVAARASSLILKNRSRPLVLSPAHSALKVGSRQTERRRARLLPWRRGSLSGALKRALAVLNELRRVGEASGLLHSRLQECNNEPTPWS